MKKVLRISYEQDYCLIWVQLMNDDEVVDENCVGVDATFTPPVFNISEVRTMADEILAKHGLTMDDVTVVEREADILEDDTW